jgi:nucleolar MIF4G domain-containing protein 1
MTRIEKDDRKFGKKFTIKVSNRKELRKQKRAEKGKRNAERHQKKRPVEESEVKSNKRQKTEPANKKKETKETTVTPPAKESVSKQKSSAEAMQRLSKSNPGLYKLLQSDNLVEGKQVDNDEFADDDRDIAYWEKKLGLNKKKDKKLGKEFEEDGLLDVLGGIEGEEAVDDQEYLRNKRLRQADQKKKANMEEKAEEVNDSKKTFIYSSYSYSIN